MDMWFYYDVTHQLHTYCNPIAAQKVDELIRILDLQPNDRILDIACGFGQLLITLASKHEIQGIGVDASPYAIKAAHHRKQAHVPHADITFIHERGENYHLPSANDTDQNTDPRFDVVMCIGASWIWHGYEGTINALKNFCKPDGLIVIGQPHWITEPSTAYLESQDFTRDEFHTLHENTTIAKANGLDLIYLTVSTQQDWDQYESLQVAALDRFARAEPNHPDLNEISQKVKQGYEDYLHWGRNTFGFATYILRKNRPSTKE